MIHDGLVQRGIKWLENNPNHQFRCSFVLAKYEQFNEDMPDVMGFSYYHTIVIECRPLNPNNKHRKMDWGLGDYRFYLCPPNVIKKSDIPEDWGLLYCHKNKITIEKEPVTNKSKNIRLMEYPILYSIIMRAKVNGYMPDILKPVTHKPIVRKLGKGNQVRNIKMAVPKDDRDEIIEYGHLMYTDDDEKHYYYADNNKLARYWANNPNKTIINQRPCIRCGRMPTKEGYDPCLGYIKGVHDACCGHGVTDGYISYDTGERIALPKLRGLPRYKGHQY